MKTKIKEIITDTTTVPMVYSTNFNSYINNMFAVARVCKEEPAVLRRLISLIGKDSDMSFIDITSKEDTISVIPASKVYKIYKTDYKEVIKDDFFNYTVSEQDIYDIYDCIDGYNGVWNSKSRIEIKIGKFIKKIGPKFTDREIEDFVNKFKALHKTRKKPKMKLVSGDDISFWYDQDNYTHTPENRKDKGLGSLGKSCMRYGKEYFDLYSKNPGICKLLILHPHDDEDTIIGRALVWKLIDGRIFMDRIYTHFDSDVHIFRAYAQKKEWLMHYDYIYNYKKVEKFSIKLKESMFKTYPYMDSFPILSVNDNILYHAEYEVTKKEGDIIYVLTTTNGKPTKI